MLSAVNHSNSSLDDLENELLKKIEISNISRQLKSKLSAINKKINPGHYDSRSAVSSSSSSSNSYSYSVHKSLPKRTSYKKYGSSVSPFGTPTRNSVHRIKSNGSGSRNTHKYFPPSSPLYITSATTPKEFSYAASTASSARQKCTSPSSITGHSMRTTPLKNRKYYRYESLDNVVSSSMKNTRPSVTSSNYHSNNAFQASSNARSPASVTSTIRAKHSPSASILSTPKSKVVRNTRNFSGASANEDEGANLLMFLATSPSPYSSKALGVHGAAHNNQFMSSPIRASKSYNEFSAGKDYHSTDGNLVVPTTPRFSYSKSHSSPFTQAQSYPRHHDYTNNSTPSTGASKHPAAITTPKAQFTLVFGDNLASTVVKTPNFNMSDYVNFLSPSPCAKKGNASGIVSLAGTPDRSGASVAERLSNVEKVSSSNMSIINSSANNPKGDETEDEDDIEEQTQGLHRHVAGDDSHELYRLSKLQTGLGQDTEDEDEGESEHLGG